MTGCGAEPVLDLADSTLKDCTKGGVLSPVRVARYAMGLFNGLTLLHSNNIIHRDLKPGNLLNAGDVLLIADFGWARELAIGNASLTSNTYSFGGGHLEYWWALSGTTCLPTYGLPVVFALRCVEAGRHFLASLNTTHCNSS